MKTNLTDQEILLEKYKQLFDVPIQEFDHGRAFLCILGMDQSTRQLAMAWHDAEIIRLQAEESAEKEKSNA